MVGFSVCYFTNIFYSLLVNFANYAYQHPWVTVLLSFFVAIILIGNVHFSKLLCATHYTQLLYDYGPDRGPHTWSSLDYNQSPVNINTNAVELMTIGEQLMWNHYNDLPSAVIMENNGRTVIVRAKYSSNIPTISGADLLHSYSFDSICFHWGFWNAEGSEHSIDFRKFPLELQATHKIGQTSPFLAANNTLVISYLFEISAHNHYLEPVIQNLHRIKRAGTIIEIPPFPLAWLCYPFKSGFYSYGGSLSAPPCDIGVEWFVNPELMAISERQLAEFRVLLSTDGTNRILRNSRPVQNLGQNRVINFNQYELSTLPLAIEPRPNEPSVVCGD